MSRCLRTIVPMVVLLAVAYSPAFARISVVLDGDQLRVSPPPIERGGRVLIGMRDIFEALGCNVLWISATQTVKATKPGTQIVLRIGSHTAHVDGQAVHLDVAPQVIRESTYVPLRFVAESTGAKVDWIAATQTVDITTRGGGGGRHGGGGGGRHGGGGGGGTLRVDPPVVVLPNDGATVGANVDVQGRGTQGGRVKILASAHRRANNEELTRLTEVTRRVKADGTWECSLSLPRVPNVDPDKLYWSIRVIAVVNGVESQATVIKVYR